ncbi:sulfotransferase 1C2A-like [Strongylocentrotus purpuratus]|uniref:Sulfotransferase domain-containing protein n=1 Tax=Strongylocentrotus purpuratus TaxID=7668 RepID=A0A7M7HF07_STRPU|nr:sulfotransferase 1C2A-like [Strongylocentrotus purpuratus]|eukprot:XP_011661042.1 PREDICTED: sulfotransferase 1C2A-like [Strongylocentrotus purpuratus]
MSARFSSNVPACVVETCYEHEGVIVPNIMPLKVLKRMRSFTVRPDDLFVVTYPKSGTTWAVHLMLLIKHDGNRSELEGKHIIKMVPFLEIVEDMLNPSTSALRIDAAEAMASPRILKSHYIPPFLPMDISTDDPKAKVLYVARNPKDAAVSFYHFCHHIGPLPSYESWDIFFEEYLALRTPIGSWFENVLPWWRKRNHPNVLFLKYEDMKRDLPGAVRQIAEFMGKSFSDDVIEKISEASTFQAMKKNPSSNPDTFDSPGRKVKSGNSFMRKGIIGDWKNYFTDDQNRRYDELYEKEMAGSGLVMDFE